MAGYTKYSGDKFAIYNVPLDLTTGKPLAPSDHKFNITSQTDIDKCSTACNKYGTCAGFTVFQAGDQWVCNLGETTVSTAEGSTNPLCPVPAGGTPWPPGGMPSCSVPGQEKYDVYTRNGSGTTPGPPPPPSPAPGPSPPTACQDCTLCKAGDGGVCIGTSAPAKELFESQFGYTAATPNWIVCKGTNQVGTVPMTSGAAISGGTVTPASMDPSSVNTQGLCPDVTIDPTPYPGSGTQTATYAKTGAKLTLDKGYCLASITKIPKVVDGNVQYVEVKDLNDGDMIRTTRGDYPLSHIMNTHTVGPHTYVKVEQGALGKNLPSQDLYITHEHSFSLGYYKNSVLNRNIHDPAQDDMVYLHITADQLADKLPGITRVQKDFNSMFNLVFDEHVSLDIYGLEVMMHHPKGNPYTLPEEKYQDKTKINNKVQKPLFANYDMLKNVKPDHMEMKDFLGNCITANLDNKFRLEDVNHPSFAPQKTMLTEDMREKLRVN